MILTLTTFALALLSNILLELPLVVQIVTYLSAGLVGFMNLKKDLAVVKTRVQILHERTERIENKLDAQARRRTVSH